jgi:hypothetical protein
MIAPSNLFSFLTKTLNSINSGFRTFLAGSIAGIYALVLYEGFPQYLFELNNSLFYFVIPVSVIVSVLVAVPKFLSRGATPKQAPKAQVQEDPLLSELLGEPAQAVQTDATTTQEPIADTGKIGGANAELDALLAGATSTPSSDTVTTEIKTEPAAMSGFDENRIRELIDQKFEPVEKDLTTFKKDLNKIKEDMKVTKESVDTLTESFEGTLTDMKAFQAEISNPLNFMRKYFEALDLTNLSDPSLPLKQGILQGTAPQPPQSQVMPQQMAQPPMQQIPVMIPAGGIPQSVPQPTPSPTAIVRGSEMDNLVKGTDLDNPMNSMMKPLFSGNLSVANMMAIVELVGEMFAEKGEDCIDLLVEQCKLMGLKSEDEHTIYNIIDMLKNSNMSTEDAISQLYKFAKIVGLNDKESDAYYARLNAKSKRERSD